jgi:hypothetical protein
MNITQKLMKLLIFLLLVSSIIILYLLVNNILLQNWGWYMLTEALLAILGFWLFEKYRIK